MIVTKAPEPSFAFPQDHPGLPLAAAPKHGGERSARAPLCRMVGARLMAADHRGLLAGGVTAIGAVAFIRRRRRRTVDVFAN